MAYVYRQGDKYIPILAFVDVDYDVPSFQKTVFEVDELMALPIAQLCNKGYVTEHCCSGHAIGNVVFVDKTEYRDTNNKDEDILSLKTDVEGICCLSEPSYGAYISFVNDYSKDAVIPKGWTYNNKKLEALIDTDSIGIEYYVELVQCINELTNWIEELPRYICN